VETALATRIIKGEIADGDVVVIDSNGETLIFEVK